jgi:AcrR family transcriptional regulator
VSSSIDEGKSARSGRHGGGPAARGRYHHGSLHASLVAATEAILAEHGIEGFTLREAARRAGVSAAAPAHHFGSAAGLLTEVAILGFEELTRFLREGAREGDGDPAARLRVMGVGYVRFALAYPARFRLMFRRDRLLWQDSRLEAAGNAAFAELESAVRALRGCPGGVALDTPSLAALIGAWSTVHGFAHLALEGKLDPLTGRLASSDPPGTGLLPEILAAMWPSADRERQDG